MPAAEESIERSPGQKTPAGSVVGTLIRAFLWLVDFLSLVKVGIVLLCILVVLSIAGMLIIQQNVQGFDAYFASLTPAERLVFSFLGLFDIYHSWYFNLLLLVLSLNIVLASIDRFPSAWSYIKRPKVNGTADWLKRRQKHSYVDLKAETPSEAVEKVRQRFSAARLRSSTSEKNGEHFAFGESGRWNRLGAYVVHAALLTLFLGHFVALRTGFDADVRMVPGQLTKEIELITVNLDKQDRFAVGLPFTIKCVDIQQKLIDPKGPIEVFNTLDWRTRIEINDPAYGVTTADVSLNSPFSYRGYRFFQAQTVPIGNARTMTLELTPQEGARKPVRLDLKRNGSAKLEDGTVVEYSAFLPDFTFNAQGQADTRSADYNNPVAVLEVTPPEGQKQTVYAFAGNIADNIPVGAPKLGYKWRLSSFERSPFAHILSIKYDPYNGSFIAWYFGGFGLIFALIFVFFVSHRRFWAAVGEQNKDGTFRVLLAGDTNRNHLSFEDRFEKIERAIGNDEKDAGKPQTEASGG